MKTTFAFFVSLIAITFTLTSQAQVTVERISRQPFANHPQTRLERKFNRHFQEMEKLYLREGMISLIPADTGADVECIIFAFKKHTNYKLVYKMAEARGYSLPVLGDLPEIMMKRAGYLLYDYPRLVEFAGKESLSEFYSGEKIVQMGCSDDRTKYTQYCLLKANWRPGYYFFLFKD